MACFGHTLGGDEQGGLVKNRVERVSGAAHHAQQVLALCHSIGGGMQEMVNKPALGINHLGLADDDIHQTEILSLVSGEETTRQHEFLGDCVADLAHHERRYGGWREAQLDLSKGKLGLLFRNHNVGGSDDAVGPAYTGSVHVHNDRLVAVINGAKQLGELLGIGNVLIMAIARHSFHIGQVGTGAKSLTVALDDDDADIIAAVEPVEGLCQFFYQCVVQRVAHLRTVEVDPSHTLAQLHLYRVEIHSYLFGVRSLKLSVTSCNNRKKMAICRNQFAKNPLLCSGNRITMDDNNLNNNLDDLLNMFKKMMEHQDLDAIPGINEEQKEQLKMFREDFDELKDDMKVEIFKLDPFSKQMVGMVMGQLKNFTGDMQQTAATPAAAPQEPTLNKEKQLTDIPGTTENLEAQLAAIDQQLRTPDLTDEQINALLDQRSAIAEELKE